MINGVQDIRISKLLHISLGNSHTLIIPWNDARRIHRKHEHLCVEYITHIMSFVDYTNLMCKILRLQKAQHLSQLAVKTSNLIMHLVQADTSRYCYI